MNSNNSNITETNNSNKMLFFIVISQFACTSLWFAGNAVISELVKAFDIPPDTAGHLSSAVQLGFITGTLTFALLTISDRYKPSNVFFLSALAGALSNMGLLIPPQNLESILVIRFVTGFFLAGIYPVGMKIASDYSKEGLGKSLGYLVGALVLGTASPYLLKGLLIGEHAAISGFSWKSVIVSASVITSLGGFAIFLFVPVGPYRKAGAHIDIGAFVRVFRIRGVRQAAFGYFGHMWELYTFWTFVPLLIMTYLKFNNFGSALISSAGIPSLSFFVIASGSVSCALGGYFSIHYGSKKTAFAALLFSCICCVVSPLVFLFHMPVFIFLVFIVFWGMAVVADSPQFSALVAANAPAESRGTALTIVNSIGFAITIISIELFNVLQNYIHPEYIFLILAPGPLFGMIAMYKMRESSATAE